MGKKEKQKGDQFRYSTPWADLLCSYHSSCMGLIDQPSGPKLVFFILFITPRDSGSSPECVFILAFFPTRTYIFVEFLHDKVEGLLRNNFGKRKILSGFRSFPRQWSLVYYKLGSRITVQGISAASNNGPVIHPHRINSKKKLEETVQAEIFIQNWKSFSNMTKALERVSSKDPRCWQMCQPVIQTCHTAAVKSQRNEIADRYDDIINDQRCISRWCPRFFSFEEWKCNCHLNEWIVAE